MDLEFNFYSTTEAQHVIDALKAYPAHESEEVQAGIKKLIWEVEKFLMTCERENKKREEDGLPY